MMVIMITDLREVRGYRTKDQQLRQIHIGSLDERYTGRAVVPKVCATRF